MQTLIIIASKNKHKVREMASMLEGQNIGVKCLDEFPEYQSPNETGLTFVENAAIKARALKGFLEKFGMFSSTEQIFVLADDSGLCCADLDGKPGVESARFAGPTASDRDNNQKLIETFKNHSHLSRGAHYTCAMVLITPQGKELTIEEYCPGLIVLVPKGNNGFGYDPYFFLKEYNQTMAEIAPAEKNRISHRGKALRKLLENLKKEL